MKNKKLLYIFILVVIIAILGFFIKDKFQNNDNLDTEEGTKIEENSQIDLDAEEDDLDPPSASKDVGEQKNSNSNDDNLKSKGYILSIDASVDFNELLKLTGLEDKMPVYSQISSEYNTATIIETNQKIGPIYLVDCNYDKNNDSYTIKEKSQQLLSEYIQSTDVLVFLHRVDSSEAKKAILLEKDDKKYLYPLSTSKLDDLSGTDLYELK